MWYFQQAFETRGKFTLNFPRNYTFTEKTNGEQKVLARNIKRIIQLCQDSHYAVEPLVDDSAACTGLFNIAKKLRACEYADIKSAWNDIAEAFHAQLYMHTQRLTKRNMSSAVNSFIFFHQVHYVVTIIIGRLADPQSAQEPA